MKQAIRRMRALEILDSRGHPTLAVEVELASSITAGAKVPSGASTGKHEAVELRDGDPRRYGGKGVRKAVRNVEELIAPALSGLDAEDQAAVDGRMIELDGTPNKSRLGANAMLGVSCAVARAAAMARGIPLWQHLAGGRSAALPVPMINILSGGLHAGRQFEFQDFLAAPYGFEFYQEALCAACAIHDATRELLDERGCVLTGVADEGGWGPRLPSNETALEVLTAAIERAGYRPGEQVVIAIDAAASHFYENGRYHLRSEERTVSRDEMIDLLAGWAERFPVFSIEDGLAEDDWEGWKRLTRRLGERLQLLGDDLFVTNPGRLERGIRSGVANAALVKMNQIGTLTETFQVIDRAREAGYRAVISARSGETEDDFLADLAVGSGTGQIKIGSVTRSSRLAKYNRLLEIEQRSQLPYSRLMVPRHFADPQVQATRSTSRAKL
jgi:enolase